MVDQWSRVVFISLALLFLLFGYSLEQRLLISSQERLALLQLRSSLGLRSREWPVRSDPCTRWAGIQCVNGRVTGINISGFRRTRSGNLNPQFSVDGLQNLTLLSSFNASNFALPGSIPQWFGSQLTALQLLDLRSCAINGGIPFSLGNLSSLVQLHLSHNNLTGIVPITLGQLFGLNVLDLSHNSLTGSIPVTISSLGNLTVLNFSSNFLSAEIPPCIGILSRLQFLNLSHNSLSSSIPTQLGDLSTLIDLDIGFNSLSGSVPSDLSRLRNLQRLVFGNNVLSGSLPDNFFPTLTQLQYLILSNNDFSGNFPDFLWSIPSLQFLDASANNFTGTMPNFIPSINATSTVFNISRNSFYGNLTSVITGLSFIDMSGNYFQGPIPVNARGNTLLTRNCLRNLTNQRNVSECTLFYSYRNLVFDNFGESNATQLPPAPPNSNGRNYIIVIILASVFGGVGLILLVVCILAVVIICKCKRGRTNQRSTYVGPIPPGGSPTHPGESLNFSSFGDALTYQQILQATDEFNDTNLIKNGHSGDLYRGILEGGINVVIKKIDLDLSVKKEAYKWELDFFSKISSPRVVPLLGHCLENENEKFLVYKYMPNGDLSSSLFKKTSTDDDGLKSLDWITRLKIAIGAAEGLSYLHHECTPPLVHRDVQASSILLDDKYEVRLGSLSQVCPQEGDANQNRITRFLRMQQTTPDQGASGTPNTNCAYDVYCFGKVLLELVTGKLGISSKTEAAMKEWLEATLPNISIYDKELVTNILDPSLIIDEDLLEEVWAMAIVARSCLNPKPNRRPLMRYILKALENPWKVVREEHSSSRRLRTMSSRGSWNAAVFGSWRHSSDVARSHKMEGSGSFQQVGFAGSLESGGNGDGNGNLYSRQQSKEIIEERLEEDGVERESGD